MGDDTEEKIENVRDNCSHVINTFFSEYFKSNNCLPPTAIIITKYDVCKDDTNGEELCEIIEEAFSPFFTKNDNKKVVAIIPVSIGTNIMDNDCTGKLKPLNIHLPIFMAIWFALSKEIQKHVVSIQEYEKSKDFTVAELRNQKAKEENKWIFKKKDEISKLAMKIQEIENTGRSQTEKMRYITVINLLRN